MSKGKGRGFLWAVIIALVSFLVFFFFMPEKSQEYFGISFSKADVKKAADKVVDKISDKVEEVSEEVVDAVSDVASEALSKSSDMITSTVKETTEKVNTGSFIKKK